MKKKTLTIYTAEDGTEFDSEEKAIEYENNQKRLKDLEKEWLEQIEIKEKEIDQLVSEAKEKLRQAELIADAIGTTIYISMSCKSEMKYGAKIPDKYKEVLDNDKEGDLQDMFADMGIHERDNWEYGWRSSTIC